jgi:3-isopropylmalate dehydrogenase
MATILTGAMLLRHTAGLDQEAAIIEKSVRKVLELGFRTRDLVRHGAEGFTVLTTTEMGAKIRETVKTMLVTA